MKVIILTCFESNEERASFVYDACQKRGYDTDVITSDFSHIRKEKRNNIPEGFIALETQGYNRNLSIGRMLSHRKFAKDAFALIEKDRPDLIWLMAPANSLIYEAKKYKQNHPEVKLIIDIIDMWPESLPVSISKNLLPFKIWRNIRKNNIGCADLLVTECDLYQEILKTEYNGKMTTIHWARDNTAAISKPHPDNEHLVLCYIGSINNIIDADKIAEIIASCDLPVKLHVIGEGENTGHFIDTLNRVCETEYHGAIRDEERKALIFDECHAGINIYRDDLYIGLTVKCIDYFEHGLPLINNIKGDTWDLVERYQAGINITKESRLNAQELMKMRSDNKRIYELYDSHFTKDVFTRKCLETIDEVLQ